LIALGGAFVGGTVFGGALVSFGRAVAGGLVQDGLFIVGRFFLCLFLVDSLLGWLHLEVVLLMGWLLVVHLSELLQDDLFRMVCLLLEVLLLCLFLVEELLGWLHLEVVLLMGWLLMGWLLVVHLAELLQEDLFGMDCLLLGCLFWCLFLAESLLGWFQLQVILLVGWSLWYLAFTFFGDLLW
jgi:hypothetical protein